MAISAREYKPLNGLISTLPDDRSATRFRPLTRMILTDMDRGIRWLTDLSNGTVTEVFDHGWLTGLGDDDHAQYLLLAGRTGQTALGASATTSGANSFLKLAGYNDPPIAGGVGLTSRSAMLTLAQTSTLYTDALYVVERSTDYSTIHGLTVLTGAGFASAELYGGSLTLRANAAGNGLGPQILIDNDEIGSGATQVLMVLRGRTTATVQSGDLTQWYDTTGTKAAYVDFSGTLRGPVAATTFSVPDGSFTVYDGSIIPPASGYKAFQFQASGLTANVTRTLTVQDANYTIAGLGVTSQTWTGTHLFTGGSSGSTITVAPTNDITALSVYGPADELGTAPGLQVYGAGGIGFSLMAFRVTAAGSVDFSSMYLWPDGVGTGFYSSFGPVGLTTNRSVSVPNASGTMVLTKYFTIDNRTTNLLNITIILAGESGTHLVNWYGVVETAAASGPSSVAITVTFTDSGGVLRTNQPVATLSTTVVDYAATGALTINSNGATAATYSLTFTTASGTPAIDSHLSVTRV